MSAEYTPPGGLGERLLAAAQQDDSWLVRFNGDIERRLTTAEVVDAYNDQRIEPDTYVWTEGMASWQQLQAVDALVDALHAEAARQSAAGGVDEPPHGPLGSNGSTQSEDSLVFSLATLVQDRPARGTTARAADDSGLIDLAALSASSEAASSPALPSAPAQELLFGGGLFPAPSAKSAPPPISPPPPAPRKQRGLIIGLSAAAALLAALLVFQIVRTHGAAATSRPGNSATTAVPEPPADDRAAQPAAAPSSATVATPSAPAGAPVESAMAMGETETPPAAGRPPSRPQPTAERPPPTSPPPVKSARPPTGACPCEEHDLMCQMRCAAN